ncbi:sigma-70 family RNA polymerase sigma factor [Saccharopolyspora sp. HNM0986]|uniref:RNA polymerase sigma factor n=1 Tax=Saccharopolyspora galaxeae TaxID=2781241 RepID=UPI00190A75E6|nr:sigma-70 family RNA polymerase sigma factor [Saccharopolyspora sp. HNM0986]MBK0870772.1 sigma-70 family RNA polymerase sigma factor [Saccharopolyspora sp. HNM0986]
MSLVVESAIPEESSADREYRLATGEFRDQPGSTERSFALVRAVQRGDTEAFGTLYAWHYDDVRCYLQRLLGDRDVAEDFASETFVRALASIDRFGYAGSGFPAWLTTIARNVAVDFLRSRRSREVCLDPLPEPPESGGAEREAIYSLGAAHVRSGVERLPANQRECVRLRFLQGRTVAETAETLGRSPAAIRQLQRRAIRGLANLLDAEWLRS